MFCPNCGTEQLQGTTFCSDCGTELSNIKNIEYPNNNNSINNIDNNSISAIPTNNQQNVNLRKLPNAPFNDPFNKNIQKQMPNMGMQQMRYPNQMIPNIPNVGVPVPNQKQIVNPNMQNMGMPMQYPNQMVNPNIPNMGMPMPPPNQMVNPNMQNMGMPMQYPNQMVNPNIPNMGMQQQININIVEKSNKKNKKSKFLASFLAFCFGGLGAHKFYLGKYGWGLLYALFPFLTFILALSADSPEIFMLSFLPSFISIVESIMYLCMSNEDFQKKY